jgi:hypothetical protein
VCLYLGNTPHLGSVRRNKVSVAEVYATNRLNIEFRRILMGNKWLLASVSAAAYVDKLNK